MPFQRLLESYFVWISAEKSTAIRPSEVDLEGVPTILQEEPCLISTLGFA